MNALTTPHVFDLVLHHDRGTMFPSAFHVLVLSLIIAALYRPFDSGNLFDTQYDVELTSASGSSARAPQRVLLVTAHPDDECLFFAPTILALTRSWQLDAISVNNEEERISETGSETKQGTYGQDEYRQNQGTGENQVFSLCLSTGDASGLGHIRRLEYEKSLDVLGIRQGNRVVLDDPYLQDNMDMHPSKSWDPLYIANVVEEFVALNNITTILTFDRSGISDHPNHKAISLGLQRMLSRAPAFDYSVSPKLYLLITVPLSIKYVSILAPLVAKFDLWTMRVLRSAEVYLTKYLGFYGIFEFAGARGSGSSTSEQIQDVKSLPVFISGIPEYFSALRAMHQHWSQLVWFRWLNVLFSRYLWVNEWAEVSLKHGSAVLP
ncbi:hypothetical protein GYMLUDRAFT_287284 [Collybiopsis luxurians FD-317 M1]|nr:hypothetical protein GYMLUDRAFT_287284 [Collybiopsis luxurians FD-317 M1]